MEHRELGAAGAAALIALERPDRRSRRLPPITIAVPLVLAGLFATWKFVGAILSSDRGIDSTDEALYVLAADPPSRSASWNVPWGWHTRPLFVLVGEDIARFRTSGAIILMIGGAFAAVMATKATLSSVRIGTEAPVATVGAGSARLLAVSAAIVGGSGAAFSYGDLLRVPGYNWVNLVGMTIAVGGFCGFVSETPPTSGFNRRRPGWPGVSAFGLFVTLPAKPSTAPLLIVLFAIAVAMSSGAALALHRVKSVVGWLVALVAVAVVVGFWPWSLARTLSRMARLPPLDRTQTVSGAVSEFLALPNRLVEAVWHFPAGVNVSLVVAACLAVAGASPGVTARVSAWLRVGALAMCALAALHVAAVPLPAIAVERPARRLILGIATSAGVVTVLGGACMVVPAWWSGSEARTRWRAWIRASAIPVVLVAAPFVFGFGSANTPYLQASMAVGFLFVAAFVMAVRHVTWSPITGGVGAAAIVATTVSMAGVTLAESRDHPYRSPPVDEMTVPIRLGASGSRLFVQPELADQIAALRAGAAAAGWQRGMPILGVVFPWSAMQPLVLDAEVPDSLMLTLFGYSGSAEWAEYNVGDLDGARWSSAWLLVKDPRVLDVVQRAAVDDVLTLVDRRVGRSFPLDYDCVATVDDVQLWRPVPDDSPVPGSECRRQAG